MPGTGKQRSHLELAFERVIQRLALPEPVREFKFRQWFFDYAWLKVKVAVEIDGGTYSTGPASFGHARGKGYRRDCEKGNAAALAGWAVLRADKDMAGSDDFGRVVRTMILLRIKDANEQRNSKS